MTNRLVSPTEPTKKHPPPIQPNAHPYAVKTTSTALLSRSNTSPHTPQHTRHHYVPLSNSRIPTGTRARHRHSSSLSSDEGDVRNGLHPVPSPLPTPPADRLTASSKRRDARKLTHRARAGTMPSSATPALQDRKSILGQDESGPGLYTGLPLNPKLWSTEELTTYLTRSLKSDNDNDSDFADIMECVRVRGLTGRELLRLTDADLADTSLSDVQRTQLLERSRTLRADVLRGRISVDSYHSHEVSDNSNDIYSGYARTSTPFHSVRGASISVDDLHSFLDDNGERVFPPSPAITLHRSNSVSDVSAERYRDLARMRMRRRGRVKGLVETWERANTSGSECSAGEEESASTNEVDSESDIDPESPSALVADHAPESLSDLPSAVCDEPVCDASVSVVDSAAGLQFQEPSSLPPPPPYTHLSARDVVEEEDEEPSIEELLASSSSVPLRGARAWEADFALGETVKRIPVSLSTEVDGGTSLVTDSLRHKHNSVRSKGSNMRRSTGSRRKHEEAQKRVVTAIFTGAVVDGGSKDTGDVLQAPGQDRPAIGSNGILHGDASASSSLHNDLDRGLRALEESIAATRAQMEAFKLRLDRVEADTARQEAMLTQPRFSDTAAPESRRRRSEAHEQSEPLRDDMPAEPVRDRDVLEVLETISLTDIARAIVAKAMGWVFPYRHLARVPEDHDDSHDRTGRHPGTNDKQSSLNKGGQLQLQLARASCSIILVSFAICAAVLRRMGFGRWVRRP